jgi:hypothetical protein
MNDNINWNRILHYNVGGKKFINPLAAWKEIAESNSSFHFSMFDECFSQYNWTVEPSQSVEELGRIRAQQLREKYSWLRLWYSGGRDSHFVLKSFIDNNIHLDEVVIFHNPFMQVRDWEMKTLVYPLAQDLLKHTRTKISTLTLTANDYEKTFSKNWHEKSATDPNQSLWFQPNNYSRLFELHPEQFSQDQRLDNKLGIILGMEKPKVFVEQGHWYMQMADVNGFVYSMDNRENVEYFYITPDLPELHAKQSWLAVNHIEKNHQDKSEQWIRQYTNCHLGPELYDDYCIAIGRGAYTHKFLGLGENKLSDKVGRSKRFQEYFGHSQTQNTSAYRYFSDMIVDLQSTMPQAFNNGDPLRGTVGILSPKYQLKKINIGKEVLL